MITDMYSFNAIYGNLIFSRSKSWFNSQLFYHQQTTPDKLFIRAV